LLIALSVAEIFGVKVEGYSTLHQILYVFFAFSNCNVAVPPKKLYVTFLPLSSGTACQCCWQNEKND